MAIPNLSDRTIFPPFSELPEGGGHGQFRHEDADAHEGEGDQYLLAEIKDNMTITKPTLVLTDRDGYPFALVFDGVGHDGLDLAKLGLKKGATAVVRGARRSVPPQMPISGGDGSQDGRETINSKAAKRPFVRIAAGQAHTVQAVPASLEQTMTAAARLLARQRDDGQRCEACCAPGAAPASTTPGAAGAAVATTATAAKKLLKCTGCGQAWYCDRACQTQGWGDGHKGECKALRALAAIWGQ